MIDELSAKAQDYFSKTFNKKTELKNRALILEISRYYHHMENFFSHILSWLIVLTILGAAVYTLIKIGQERSDFLDDCYFVKFFDIELPIPNWWTLVFQSKEELIFKRTDTSYDWSCSYKWFPENSLPLIDILESLVKNENIFYDKLDVVITTNPIHIFKDEKIINRFQEVIRVEGQASQETERIYLDLILARDNNQNGFFIFESKSSVLTGLVEGPYFEESIKLMKISPV